MANYERNYRKLKSTSEPLSKLIEYQGKQISDTVEIANSFNDFYVSIGKNLASKIPNVNKNFKDYLKPCRSTMNNENITTEELKEAFKSLLPNKIPGVDEISSNVIKKVN